MSEARRWFEPMRFLSTMSTKRALLIAVLWPTLLFALPLLMIAWFHVSNWWNEHFGGDSFTVTFIGTGGRVSSPWLSALVLFGPPAAFLMVWAATRRR